MSPFEIVLALALLSALYATRIHRRAADRARRDLQAVLATASELQRLADHDVLTGLVNRRRFEQELDRHLAHVRRYGAEGAAIVLDLDRFKPVNDTFGHAAGDRLLARVGQVLRDRLRTTDVVARLGGDEFAILLPRGDRDGAAAVAQSLVDTVRAQALTADARGVTVSVGVMTFEACGALGAESIVAGADLAMYEAKKAGGNRFAFYGADPRPVAATLAA